MQIEQADATGKMVFEAKRVTRGFGGSPVVRDFSTRIVRGDRVGLIGPNGSGKTTALRLLIGELEPDEGEVRRGARLEIAYFDQQREQLDPGRTVAESVADGDTVLVNGEPRHVLGYLADFLFPRERARSPVMSLSGGERNRLLLARLFAKPANVLVLDEPTNDLDLETLDLLEDLISTFDGTVLVVTHDRVFLDNVVTSTLAFDGSGDVTEYVGGWDDYLRQSATGPTDAPERSRRSERAPRLERPDPAGPSQPPERSRKKTYKEEREYEGLPTRIAALEAEHRRLHEETASPEFYKAPAEHIRSVLARIDEINRALEQALERWIELEAIGKT